MSQSPNERGTHLVFQTCFHFICQEPHYYFVVLPCLSKNINLFLICSRVWLNPNSSMMDWFKWKIIIYMCRVSTLSKIFSNLGHMGKRQDTWIVTGVHMQARTHILTHSSPSQNLNTIKFLAMWVRVFMMRYAICVLSDSVVPLVMCVGGFLLRMATPQHRLVTQSTARKAEHHEWSFSKHRQSQAVKHFHMLDLLVQFQ